MAERRKLMAEIDKCLKKIDEGVEEFETIMAKMQDANSDNQRDKYQEDLKKEIKKLQRLRDAVKGWQNNGDIKDKDRLGRYRKIIEHRMEQFKDIERENKTKPHSKLGLCAEEKVDPKEKEKKEATEWIQSIIGNLEFYVDQTETSLENLTTAAEQTSKKGRKGKDDGKKNELQKKSEDLRKHCDRLKYHMMRMELCMRLVNNETLDPKQVLETMKEQVEMYIGSLNPEYDSENGPSEALDPEDLYEELALPSYATTLGGVMQVPSIDHDSEKPADAESSAGAAEHHPSHEEEHAASVPPTKTRHSSERRSPAPSRRGHSTKHNNRRQSTDSPPRSPAAPAASVAVPAAIPPPPGLPYNSVVSTGLKPKEVHPPPAAPATPCNPTPASVPSASTPAAAVAVSSAQATPAPCPPPTERPASVKELDSKMSAQFPSLAESIATQPQQQASTPPYQAAFDAALPTDSASQQQSPQSSQDAGRPFPGNYSASSYMDAGSDVMRLLPQRSQQPANETPLTAKIPAWLGAAPLGRVQHTTEFEGMLKALEETVARVPTQFDSERPRAYMPPIQSIYVPYYPRAPPPNADSVEYYQRLNAETLFFIFYHLEGSAAQLLAAKALKRGSWRFHTKYLMWFQRHDEPTKITDEYEQGTYIYFDYEKWATRRKESFIFEYRYLEDKEFE